MSNGVTVQDNFLEELRQDGYIVLEAHEMLAVEGSIYKAGLAASVGARKAHSAKWGVLVQGGHSQYEDGSCVEVALNNREVLGLFGHTCTLYADVDGELYVFQPPTARKKTLHTCAKNKNIPRRKKVGEG